ncbi:MAG: rod shape-determining protein MreC [Lutibacter sp.]|uniref:rod shape-determining protein MreC n=1 Tax=Lutibacter sp. TaxID=1925666 RepID=UPI0019EB37AA|nr:rod shape-determining protein MreC [Lutibacter sp.]NOR27230.1 rod shape-determining protein MreC [Lutibacter sp.]
MQQIIYFIRKFRYFLLFLLLEILAITFTIQQHSYHTSKFVNSANFITGGLYNTVNNVNEFFLLRDENKLLIEENVRLKNLLNKKEINYTKENYTVIDTVKFFQKYEYSVAKVIKNNYTNRNNILTLNKGTKQGLATDLGVINSLGIIGVVKNTSSNYSTVLSILNGYSKINVRLKNSNHYGTLSWNGENHTTAQLEDIPRQAVIKVGDTIITGGKSAIFPEGIHVGIIKDFIFENNKYQQINTLLFNDMTSIGYVQIVDNLQKKEQNQLEQQTNNE